METNRLALKTVKVISQKIVPDWVHPYKNKRTSRSIGSGFFIDNQGHLLTCSQVVDDAMKIFIEIPNHGDEKIEVEDSVVGNFEFDNGAIKSQGKYEELIEKSESFREMINTNKNSSGMF